MSLGCSINCGKTAIKEWIKYHCPSQSTILDIGAGGGTYADLLNDLNYKIDAIEIHDAAIPAIINKYNTIFNMDLRDFNFFKNYDLVIMGDILEHLNIKDAQEILLKVLAHTKWLLVAVPFNYPQGPEDDNPTEEHLQPDLNLTTMQERYPQLELLLYIKNNTELIYIDTGLPYTIYYAYYIAKGALYNE